MSKKVLKEEAKKPAPKKEEAKKPVQEEAKKPAPKKEEAKKSTPKKEFAEGQTVVDNKGRKYQILSLPKLLNDESKISLLDSDKKIVIRLKRKLRLA